MRIAFVGKGGSGKSTIAASFALYLLKQTVKPAVVFDADLNIHIPELLGFRNLSLNKYLSHPENAMTIKKWLIGNNEMQNFGAFRKTTPPTQKSNIIRIKKINETPLADFGERRDNLIVFAVGTYQEEEIGASCYHNNLAILESILNHTDDKCGYIIADMVAGVDSFANTLHAQFDLICLIVEPTQKGIEVYKKYRQLAKEAGTFRGVFVIGNKIRNERDKEFIKKHIEPEKILGYFSDDDYIRNIDQTGESLYIDRLTENNRQVLNHIFTKLDSFPDCRQKRLEKIWELHKKYVAQAFVKERFGDLASQIDTEFSFNDKSDEQQK